MADAQNLIEKSLRLIKVVTQGQTPSTIKLNDCLEALNSMLDGWALHRLAIQALTAESHALVAGTNSYTIGSGATWNTVRPVEIRNAFLRDTNGYDYPVRIISRKTYNNVPDKTVQSRPDELWYDDQNPTATIYLHPTPDDSTDTLFIDSVKPFTAVATLATSIIYPPGYEETVKYNLAVRLAAEFDAPVPPHVAQIADETFTALKGHNLRPLVAQLGVPDSTPWPGYNINTDER